MEITVVVFCYNSAETIVETLESVYRQTYKDIYLVISDDCSSDDSIITAKKWIDEFGGRFTGVEIKVNETNSGTSLHFDNRMREAKTEWVKPIAGDDILLSDCIQNYVDFIQKNDVSGCGIIVSDLLTFIDAGDKRKYRIDAEEENYQDRVLKLNASAQFKNIIRREILCSPTMLINSEIFRKIGGELIIRNIEDWPYKIKTTKSGYLIKKMKKQTVLYRQGESISREKGSVFKIEFLKQLKRLKEIYCYPHIPGTDIVYWWNEKITDFRYWFIIKVLKNRRNRLSWFINILFGSMTTSKFRKLIINIADKKKTEERILRFKEKYIAEIKL